MIADYSLDWKKKFPDAVIASGNLRRGISIAKKTEVFIYRARQLYGDVYNYSEATYVSAKEKIRIACSKHGIFEQAAQHHLAGSGCPSCAPCSRKTTDDFILKAVNVHNNKYDYSNVDYTTSKVKVVIICKTHGKFEQTPSNHLQGYGCPNCAHPSRPDKLYILTDGIYHKIGITNNISRRVRELSLGMQKRLEIIAVCSGIKDPSELESKIHSIYPDNPYKDEKFDGHTEWRKLTERELNSLVEEFNFIRIYE